MKTRTLSLVSFLSLFLPAAAFAVAIGQASTVPYGCSIKYAN